MKLLGLYQEPAKAPNMPMKMKIFFKEGTAEEILKALKESEFQVQVMDVLD